MTTIDCICNTCTAIHTCRPTAATYLRHKYLVPNYNPANTDAIRYVRNYRCGDAYSYYIRQRRAALQTIGRAYGALLRLQNATPATLDPLHIYNFVVDGYDRDEPQRAFFRTTLHSRVSLAFEIFLGRERGEKYADALRRAESMFVNGEYERPSMGPMFKAGQAKRVFKHLNFLHNLHWSKKFPGQVAYAESYDKLVADRWTTCKPGRYLTKFFSDVLDENQIRAEVQYMAASTLPAELHYIEHDDPDGWVHVYANGPDSCMRGDDCVKVYAHDESVLRLAYLKQNDFIMARCIVREDTKEWIRCYPNTDSEDNQRWHSLMQNYVTNAGYTHGNLHGVLLDAIKVGRSYDSRYVCPYIDSGNGDKLRAELQYSGGKEYLRLGDDGGEATNTSGYVDMEDGREACVDCDDMYDPDEMGYVEDHGNVCECCMQNNYTSAWGRRYEELTPNDEVIECESNGSYYHRDFAHYHEVYECEVTGDWYHIDDLVLVKDGYVHINECTALGVDDDEGNSYAIEGSTTTTWDNRVIRKDESCVWFGKVCHKDDDPNELNETSEEGNE